MVAAYLYLSLAKTQLIFDVRFSEIANLTYQLDSITGQIPHEANGRYKALWEKNFLATAQDREVLNRWKTNRVVNRQTNGGDRIQWPLTSPFHDGDPEVRVRAVGFDATSSADYTRRIASALPKKQSAILAEVVQYFQPRFHLWWESTAVREGSVFTRDMKALLDSPSIKSLMDQFVSFYQPDLGTKFTLPFVLMYKPSDGPRESSSGQQLEKHSLVQFLAGEKPEQRVEVVLHEVCHFLYNHGPKERHLAFQKGLVATKRQSVVPAFNLLDEGLATVFGNGLIAQVVQPADKFERRKAQKLSWYNNPGIDLTGKTMFPWIPAYLASGKTLYDSEFSQRYLDSMEAAFGSSLTQPSRYMSSLYMILPSDFDPTSFGIAREVFNCYGMYSSLDDLADKAALDQYKELGGLGAIIVVKPENISRLTLNGVLTKQQTAELTNSSNNTSAMMAIWGSRLAPTYVIVANKASDAQSWIRQISKLTEFREGLVPML